jgi:hypothetical protein
MPSERFYIEGLRTRLLGERGRLLAYVQNQSPGIQNAVPAAAEDDAIAALNANYEDMQTVRQAVAVFDAILIANSVGMTLMEAYLDLDSYQTVWVPYVALTANSVFQSSILYELIAAHTIVDDDPDTDGDEERLQFSEGTAYTLAADARTLIFGHFGPLGGDSFAWEGLHVRVEHFWSVVVQRIASLDGHRAWIESLGDYEDVLSADASHANLTTAIEQSLLSAWNLTPTI